MDVVRKPEVSNTSVLTKLHLGDVPKFHCALSEKWGRQVTELALKPPAPTVHAPLLQGDQTSWGPAVS